MYIRILLVDDHQLIINGIMAMLDADCRYQVVGQALNGLDVYRLCQETRPDMVILDLGLPGMDGLDVLAQLHRRWPALRKLVLTSRQEEHHAIKALRLGAAGFVLKKSPPPILLRAIQTVANGKQYLDPQLDSNRIALAAPAAERDPRRLTCRERQVLKQIAEGAGNVAIASALSISPKTVETHRLNIMRKLDVHKVTELIRWSHRLGLVEYPAPLTQDPVNT